MDHVLPPLALLRLGRPARVDRCQRDRELREQRLVVVRHRVVATHEHPGARRAEVLDKSSEERCIVKPVHLKLGGRYRESAACLQLRGDAVVDVGIDDEQTLLGQ